jgi:hypothetical protein
MIYDVNEAAGVLDPNVWLYRSPCRAAVFSAVANKRSVLTERTLILVPKQNVAATLSPAARRSTP